LKNVRTASTGGGTQATTTLTSTQAVNALVLIAAARLSTVVVVAVISVRRHRPRDEAFSYIDATWQHQQQQRSPSSAVGLSRQPR